jgi:hypothetical protein
MAKKNETFIANLPTKKVVLSGKQSPRGLREGASRVLTFDVNINDKYDAVELSLLVRYLYELVCAMETVKLN